MQSVIKKLDTRNRVLIPNKFREALHMDADEELEVRLYEEGIFISSARGRCIFCGQFTNNKYRSKHVCPECVVDMNAS